MRKSLNYDHSINPIIPATQADILYYLLSTFEKIVAEAQLGYEREGRGAVVIDLRAPVQVTGGYLSLSRMLIELGATSGDQAAIHLQTYQPAREIVVFARLPGERVFLFKFGYDGE